jgi:tetratricopeptide (TPR) repeat protein
VIHNVITPPVLIQKQIFGQVVRAIATIRSNRKIIATFATQVTTYSLQVKMGYLYVSLLLISIADKCRYIADPKSSIQYYNLGKYGRVANTKSEKAQAWFDRGLVWCYSFNHEAAAYCFEQAAVYDPQCVMAYWGIAYAIGPNYNKSWRMFTQEDRESSIAKVRSALAQVARMDVDVPPVEEALVAALNTRFPPSSDNIPTDLSQYDYAYAEAMRPVYEAHSEDLDVIALFADAIMCTRPRRLWDLDTGKTTGTDIDEARAALEKGLALPNGRDHPGLCHLYIHMMEMSPYPELALTAADQLRRLVPDGSHMQHMATHIDVACGDYRRAVDSNMDAVVSDDKYYSRGDVAALIYQVYRSHNLHALAYAAMMSGRSAIAIHAARRLPKVLTQEFMSIETPRMVDWTEWQWATLPHVMIRFGRWEEILELQVPADWDLLCVSAATVKYAKGIALASLGRIEEARKAKVAFEDARQAVPADRLYGPTSPAAPVLAVASAMLEGELEYRMGNFSKAFATLRRGIELEDKLSYADPPLWMQPLRHALGALLLEQGHSVQAEQLYMEDLGLSNNHPRRKARINNVWGLHGLYECFARNGKHEWAASIRLQRDIAIASTDVPIQASCFCRLSAIDSRRDCKSI